MSPRTHLGFAVAASLVGVFALVWGFVLVGSPMSRRLERFDEQRLRDLQTVVREIQLLVEDQNNKGTLKNPLPTSLAQAAQRARDERVNPRDPETGAPYSYRVTSETTYEICANFALPRDSDSQVFWNHPAGEHCFSINVLDPPLIRAENVFTSY